MAEPTITEVFGINSNLTSGGLNVSEAMFEEFGIQDPSTLNPEGCFVALILRAKQVLTEENRNLDTVNRQVTIVDSGQDLINQNGTNYRRQAYTILLYKPEALPVVNPADY